MDSFPLSGGCHCGDVRYSLAEPALSVQHCHCSQCRKIFATLCAQGAVINEGALTLHGEDRLIAYESSPGFRYYFCRTCGCHVLARSSTDIEHIYFMPATLDHGAHPGHPPDKEAHTFVNSKAEWDHFNDHLPWFDSASPDEISTELMRLYKD